MCLGLNTSFEIKGTSCSSASVYMRHTGWQAATQSSFNMQACINTAAGFREIPSYYNATKWL